MVVRKQKRSRKHRGSRTHGWGFGKRHRGKGNKPYRSGGVGKRGAHRETFFLSQGIQPIGKHGMSVTPRIAQAPQREINLKDIGENLQKWAKQGLVEEKSGVYSLDLGKLGVTKLLSEGFVDKKLQITCKSCSAKAKEKVEAAGGSVVLK